MGQVERNSVVNSIRTFLAQRDMHFNSCEETEKELKRIREEATVLEGLSFSVDENTSLSSTVIETAVRDEVRLWAENMEDAILRGEALYEESSELERFLINYNALKAALTREELKKDEEEHRSDISAILERNNNENQGNEEAYDESLLKKSLDQVRRIVFLKKDFFQEA